MDNIIDVNSLYKEYDIYNHTKNIFADFLRKKRKKYTAIKDITFSVKRQEIVGLVGINGAGKSTLIKLLTGILYPTSGTINVNGMIPYKERRNYLMDIGVVFGQRSQLWWDLPVIESYNLIRTLYKLSNDQFKNNLNMFCEILDLGKLLYRPVRQLSLGERMKCEIAGTFLTEPLIAFLDEPTIGLDILIKEKILDFIKNNNRKNGTTVFITSHNMSDIEKICDRVIILNNGEIIFDNSINEMLDYYKKKMVTIFLNEPLNYFDFPSKNIKVDGRKIVMESSELKHFLLMDSKYKNVSIEKIEYDESGIEDIIKQLYKERL